MVIFGEIKVHLIALYGSAVKDFPFYITYVVVYSTRISVLVRHDIIS